MAVQPTCLDQAAEALEAARQFAEQVRASVVGRVGRDGLDPVALRAHQRQVHGLAWIATQVAALQSLHQWTLESHRHVRFGEPEQLVLLIGFGEYLAQLLGGVPMNQIEFVRPIELGVEDAAERLRHAPSVAALMAEGFKPSVRARLVELCTESRYPTESLVNETLDMIREQFRSFARRRIAPHVQLWHLTECLLPDDVVADISAMGTPGLCIDPRYGGSGLGKLAMCIASEELSRAWIAAGSLGTRSEIAADLIGAAGTDEQRERWLPRIASGEVLPTAVFTEPEVGSDLASLRTRAERTTTGRWRFFGNKTWITHASRSDLMTLLARTEPGSKGHEGLSMFLVPKQRGTPERPFPDEGLRGEEIRVLGYRGLKEYSLAFDGFETGPDALLGGLEGQGFRQLMRTFEAARIQTAARALGVAWSAFDISLEYAAERRQFGRAIIEYPRISDKLALMLVETIISRELTYAAARRKDEGARCDVEAGMAKLLAARVAWSCADAALQIHGANGYALEAKASRILCDARILNIFEGTAEIQADVIGRGLLR